MAFDARAEEIANAVKPRSVTSSKRENGRVLVVGGSDRFHGAPVLAALAALRVGTGYVTLCVPKSIVNPVRRLSPDVIVRPLSGDVINGSDLEVLTEEAEKADVVVVGMGAGRDEESLRTIAKLVAYCAQQGKRVVVDADAIYALRFLKKKLNRRVVLTPNDKEFTSLYSGKLDKKDVKKRIALAVSVARKTGAVVLLKGHTTIITDGKQNKTVMAMTSALAVMGTGDVLSGIIGDLRRGTRTFSYAQSLARTFMQ